MPFSPLEESGSKSGCAGHAPCGAGRVRFVPTDVGTNLCILPDGIRGPEDAGAEDNPYNPVKNRRERDPVCKTENQGDNRQNKGDNREYKSRPDLVCIVCPSDRKDAQKYVDNCRNQNKDSKDKHDSCQRHGFCCSFCAGCAGLVHYANAKNMTARKKCDG